MLVDRLRGDFSTSSGNLIGSRDGRYDLSQIQVATRVFGLTLQHGFSARFGYALSTDIRVS